MVVRVELAVVQVGVMVHHIYVVILVKVILGNIVGSCMRNQQSQGQRYAHATSRHFTIIYICSFDIGFEKHYHV